MYAGSSEARSNTRKPDNRNLIAADSNAEIGMDGTRYPLVSIFPSYVFFVANKLSASYHSANFLAKDSLAQNGPNTMRVEKQVNVR